MHVQASARTRPGCLKRTQGAFSTARPVRCSSSIRPPISSPACNTVSSSTSSNSWTPATSSGRASKPATSVVCQATPRNAVFLFGFGGSNAAQEEEYDDEVYTVAKLQVAIFGDVRGWQQKLDRLASQYDTEDPEGLFAAFQDAVTMLLRNTSVIGYATSAGKMFDNLDDAEAKFNQVSLEERSKFSEETLVNYDGRRKASAPALKAGDAAGDDWLCVTLLMAVEGQIKIAKAENIYELKKSMTALGVVNADNLVAFELLWTPQEAGESYNKDALLMDYPTMINMS